MNIHEKYINRCIDIAKNGLGNTAPNPMVGCVIVYKDAIIGEGFTSAYGGNHAEVNAIESVQNPALLKNATLYVTLEPCSHFGKTPPCADLIVKCKIPKVVIGTVDTNSKVAGKGIQKLKDSGCEVIVGVLEAEVKLHHKRFFTFHNKKRPYIILKWATSSDGFIAPLTKSQQRPVWISNPISRQLVHKWRAEEQAILVGTNTVLDDDPSLTTRDWTGHNPIRIVLDPNARLPQNANVFDPSAKTLRLIKNSVQEMGAQKNSDIYMDWDSEKTFAAQICKYLYEQDLISVIVEGGRQTLQTFIDADLWDEARVFTGPLVLNSGISAPQLKGRILKEEQMMDDILKIYTND